MRLRTLNVVILIAVAAIAFSACQEPAEPPPPQPVESAADKAAKVAEANKALFMRFMDEVGNQGQTDKIGEIVSTDFVEHQELPPDVPPGVEGLTQFFTGIRQAFPDLTITVDVILASDDLVAGRSTWTGTQATEWMGMQPSGSPVAFEAIDVVRFKDGKAVEHWGLDNSAEMMMRAAAK